MENKKLIFVLTGPSQVGKTTGKEFLMNALGLETIPSFTTRSPFDTEQDGVDYHFISDEEFEDLKKRNEFLESSDHYGARYATGKDHFYETIASNRPVVVAINVDGADSFKEEFGDNCVIIFVAPPNPEVWMERVKSNRGNNEDRVSEFTREMERKDSYDHLIINDDLSSFYRDLGSIVSSLLD